MKLMNTSPLRKLLAAFLLCAVAALRQYKQDPAGPPPPEIAAAMLPLLHKDGAKISNGAAPYCEVWLRTSKPSGGAAADEGVTFPGIPVGTFLGVIRFDGKGADRRGQGIKPGVYTLRYGLIPINGDHQGAAPQRDFLVLVPAADDKDPAATPNFDALMVMSRKASGTPHPAVLSFWKPDSGAPGFSQQGEDWVLQTKLGDAPVAIILIGIASS
jgi:hypothetical protein